MKPHFFYVISLELLANRFEIILTFYWDEFNQKIFHVVLKTTMTIHNVSAYKLAWISCPSFDNYLFEFVVRILTIVVIPNMLTIDVSHLIGELLLVSLYLLIHIYEA